MLQHLVEVLLHLHGNHSGIFMIKKNRIEKALQIEEFVMQRLSL